jgi:predicted enzyme related to lactoylglutathione lyase
MAEMTEYAPGTPSWVDLGSPDVEASEAFYEALFGWEAQTSPDPAAGGYTQFLLRGRTVAGLGPLFVPDQPPAWTTYVTVASADETVEKAGAAGAEIVMAPFDVLDAGRMAIFRGPSGAALSVWEPGTHIGAQLVNEPGALSWTELASRDVEGEKAFFSAVFGWEASTAPFGETTYTEWKLGGRSVAGMIEMNDEWPPEVPAHWMVYFAVGDTDASAARVQELGGTVSVPPTDIPPGRFAIVNDPHGAVFSIIKTAAVGRG